MDVGIIGGGILGMSIGYFLSQQGAHVEIFEASPVLGGLAGPATLPDGVKVDRFYHTILSSDRHLQTLCAELGLTDRLRFRETRMGFYDRGQIYPMNSLVDFMRFPPLGWPDRFRLGLTILYAQFVRDWRQLESISVEEWLVRWSGRRAFDNLWRPMLRAKFDGSFEDTPATYIWARLVRMKSARGGANQKEMAGHLAGGYATLVDALARKIEACGGTVRLACPVQDVAIEGDRATGICVGGELHRFDAVVGTLQAPVFRRLIPGAPEEYRASLDHTRYLGIVCGLLALDRPLTGYWTLNITDDRVPFTGVIETTTYIDPQFVGGYHLVYLPKYTAPGSPWQQLSEDEIRARWLTELEKLFPSFQRSWICHFQVYRERFVEPLHGLAGEDDIPGISTPV